MVFEFILLCFTLNKAVEFHNVTHGAGPENGFDLMNVFVRDQVVYFLV